VAEVAPKQANIGVMLPYTPLHYLIFSPERGIQISKDEIHPLVMTSGNLSDEPIATGNDEARQRLASLADAFLMHNRDIRTRCDDSVIRVPGFQELESRVIPKEGKTTSVYFLRRSRGYAPDPIQLPFEAPALLATGPDLKNTFCVSQKYYAFISHHIGDMENYETLISFEDGVEHFERLFRINPQAIICDLHPDYLSSRYAIQRSQHENLPLIHVQHHHAHIAACMADNGLDGSHPVIGLAFDGTGYGEALFIWTIFLSLAGMQRLKGRHALLWLCSGTWGWIGMTSWLRSRIYVTRRDRRCVFNWSAACIPNKHPVWGVFLTRRQL
jgi:hydrogenase maturation protein HypF